MRVTIALPAYDEAGSLERVVAEARATIANLALAGEAEILPVLAYDASLVDLSRATNPSPLERGLAQHALYRRMAAQPILADFRTVAPSGWYGPIGSPTPERAEAFVEAVAERAAAYIRETFEGLRKEGT